MRLTIKLALSSSWVLLACLQGCMPASNLSDKSVKKTQSDSSNSTSAANQTWPAKANKLVPRVRLSATDETRNTCGKMCRANVKCEESAAKSFCKWDQERPACFSLYWTDQYHETVCHVREQNCAQTHPVECGIVDDSKPNVINTVSFLTDLDVKKNSCQGLCDLTPSCTRSSCLDNLDYPVCTGLYWTGGTISQTTVVFETDLKKAKREGHTPVECGIVQYVTKHKKKHHQSTILKAFNNSTSTTTTTTTTAPSRAPSDEEPTEEVIEDADNSE